jgi:hypothetical protein
VTDGLFSRAIGVAVGDVFIDRAIEASGIPDPMMRLVVVELDETGMVHIEPRWSGPGRRVVVSPKSLNERYRKE